jgi:probable rRNA maturation factor
VTPEERPSYLGDVVISYERAAEQAPEYGHSASAEVGVLLIHGLLHLLGYDDANDEERSGCIVGRRS